MKNVQLNHDNHKVMSLKYPICFIAHDIDIPLNVGSFFRIADALGVEKIYLTGRSVVPPNSKIKKTSRSTEKHVPYEYAEDPFPIIERIKEAGYKVLSLEITSNSIELSKYEVSTKDKICLILGSENQGVSQGLLSISDATVHISMLGVNSSMNVASACAIATYELTKRFEK